MEESQEEGWAPGTYLLPLQQHPGSPSSVARTNGMNGTPRSELVYIEQDFSLTVGNCQSCSQYDGNIHK